MVLQKGFRSEIDRAASWTTEFRKGSSIHQMRTSVMVEGRHLDFNPKRIQTQPHAVVAYSLSLFWTLASIA